MYIITSNYQDHNGVMLSIIIIIVLLILCLKVSFMMTSLKKSQFHSHVGSINEGY